MGVPILSLKFLMKTVGAGAAALIALLVVSVSARPSIPDTTPFFTGLTDPESLARTLGERLAAAQHELDRLLTVTGPRTIDNTLRPYDNMMFEIASAQGPAYVIAQVNPDERMRQTADAIVQQARTRIAERLTNQALYTALGTIDARKADAQARYYLARELADFRRHGADKDAATREQIAAMTASIAADMAEFNRNLRGSSRTVSASSVEALEGLPADFIARHKPDAAGSITLRPDDSDRDVVLTFATRDDLRKRMFFESANVGYPENVAVLNRLIGKRWQLAHVLGFDSWAALEASTRMVREAGAASTLIDRAIREAKPKVAREYDALLKRKQQDVEGATAIDAWEYAYYRELVRKDGYAFDSQSVRPYFPFERVQQGVLDVASRLYGLTFRRAPDVPVWHQSVVAFEVIEGDTLLGRIYLDPHPRASKPLGSATSIAFGGLAGRQLPEAVVRLSVPGGQPGDPGLMTHDNVRAMFHEFGHALALVLAGHQQWFGLDQPSEEDFYEVPALLSEEFVSDPAVLALFARHYQTNEPIPPDLVVRMRRAEEFAKGMSTTGQNAFSQYALVVHEHDPSTIDPVTMYRDILSADAPWLYAPGTHREASFAQIANTNYTSAYYAYAEGPMIAKDLLATRFDPVNLLAPAPARRYRAVVLNPGGSKPASQLVKEFLGRPPNERAWGAWLNRDP